MAYNFTVKLQPWGDNPERGSVGVDKDAMYGYWEHKDGTEGGGLWFEGVNLVDYDGDYMLPMPVIDSLRLAGFTVEEIFE
jgi:hypothetical protein